MLPKPFQPLSNPSNNPDPPYRLDLQRRPRVSWMFQFHRNVAREVEGFIGSDRYHAICQFLMAEFNGIVEEFEEWLQNVQYAICVYDRQDQQSARAPLLICVEPPLFPPAMPNPMPLSIQQFISKQGDVPPSVPACTSHPLLPNPS